MGRIVVGTFVSLDGVLQAPSGPDEDRSGGFELGGWLVPRWNDEMMSTLQELVEKADALLLGRKTYEIFAGHWPKFTDPNDRLAARMNSARKYLVTRTLERADWNNSTVIRGDVPKQLAAVKKNQDGEIQVMGSSGLIQTLLAENLVDEFRIWTFPVLLGKGKRLFGDGTRPMELKRRDAKRFDTGVTLETYLPAGAVTHGTYGVD